MQDPNSTPTADPEPTPNRVLGGIAAVFGVICLIAAHWQIAPWLFGRPHPQWLGGLVVATAATGLLLAGVATRNNRRLQKELLRRQRVEERLRVSEQEAREADFQKSLLLESSADGIYALDMEGRCLWANAAAVQILGQTSAAALVGRQMHDIIHHTRADGTPFPASECGGLKGLRVGQSIHQPQELLWRADGTSFYADIRVSPMVHDGKMMGGVVSFRDLTERLRLEERYRQAQKLEVLGLLAAGIAHNFNNLLTVINGYTEMLLEQKELDPGSSKRLQGIQQAGAQAATLIRQMADFSRQEALEHTVFSINQIVRPAETAIRQVLGAGVTLEVDLAADLAPVRAAAVQLEQVIMSLVVNAREAMPHGGHLRLKTSNVVFERQGLMPRGLRADRYAMLEVKDSGIGMDPETCRRIFEPFFTTKPPGQGAGLSLATALHVVQKAGGTITAESLPGRGTTLRLFLPARGSAQRADAAT